MCVYRGDIISTLYLKEITYEYNLNTFMWFTHGVLLKLMLFEKVMNFSGPFLFSLNALFSLE